MIARTSSFTTVNGTILSLMVNAMCYLQESPSLEMLGKARKSNITFNHFHPLYPNPHLSFPLNTSAGHVFFCEKISFHPLPPHLNPNLTSTPPNQNPPKQNIHLPPWAGEPTSGNLPGYQGQFSAARYNSQSLLGLGEVTDLLGSLGAPGRCRDVGGGKGTGV